VLAPKWARFAEARNVRAGEAASKLLMIRAFSPSLIYGHQSWGSAPRWYTAGLRPSKPDRVQIRIERWKRVLIPAWG